MNTKRVMVVEDDPLVRDVIEENLTDRGFHVLGVQSADAAIDLLQSRFDICLVFSDIDLPGAHNGIALARWATEHRPDLKIILISGRIEPGAGLLPAGVAFIPKPLDFDEISAIAAAHCSQVVGG